MFPPTQQHVAEARMHAERRHGASVRGDATARIERVELDEQLARLRERRGGRRVEPTQLQRVDDSRRGQVEHERRQIGTQNLRRRLREQMMVFMLRPQTVAHAGTEPASAPAPLVGRRA